MSDWTRHLETLAVLENNAGKKVAFKTSAEKICDLEKENQQLKQRIEQLERECNFMRDELVDSYCMNPIWLDEQIEQLRKGGE